MFGLAVKEACHQKGIKGKDLAQRLFISNGHLSDIERGRREPTKETTRAICAEVDHPQVTFEAQIEFTGSGIPWLNNIDRHPAVMSLKAEEELTEALEKLQLLRPFLLGKPLIREELKEVMMECKEASTAVENFVSEMCVRHDFSYNELTHEHIEELKQKGYLKKEKTACSAVR